MQIKPVVMISLLLVAASCSKQETPPPDAAAPAPNDATTLAAPEKPQLASACELVTAAEMSTILGGTVTTSAGGNERPPSSTECIYASAGGSAPGAGLDEVAGPNPYAEVEVDWGGGDPQTLDTATDLANSAAPAAADSLKGLGDRAYKVTADQVFISSHGDLMMIRFPRRSEDVNAKARKIFETAKPRM